MTKHTNQIAVIVALSILIAAQSFFLASAPSKEESTSPAAQFNTQIRPVNVARTLRPEGQTENAQLCDEFTFEEELDAICPELRQSPFSLDAYYLSPTAQTAKLMLRRAFRKLENVYVSEAYDCDDNAQELMILLRKEALVEYREFPAALAIGFVGVRIDGPIYEYIMPKLDPSDYPLYHAMVVMRIKGGRWLLIEPLTHQVCELTGPIFEGQISIELIYF